MPELPEVETTLQGIKPFVLKQKIQSLIIRHHGLRWPIPPHLPDLLKGHIIQQIWRRGKYLIFQTTQGYLLLHLGMSGSLRILAHDAPAKKHDHVDILLANGNVLRFHDPRRFGALLWTSENPDMHALLINLGPEPLDSSFSGEYLWKKSRNRKTSVKTFIMDSKIVVGVGNIYAAESLFDAKLLPKKIAGKISLKQYQALARSIKKILKAAIKKGGTTLRDFVNSDGNKGYFSIQLKVYGRGGKQCLTCATTLKQIRQGQRTTVYCPQCQR
jgi:formamidopyrimidine-DNA glycosylase